MIFKDFSVIKGRRCNVEIVTNVKCVLYLKNISLLHWQFVFPKSCGISETDNRCQISFRSSVSSVKLLWILQIWKVETTSWLSTKLNN